MTRQVVGEYRPINLVCFLNNSGQGRSVRQLSDTFNGRLADSVDPEYTEELKQELEGGLAIYTIFKHSYIEADIISGKRHEPYRRGPAVIRAVCSFPFIEATTE